MQQPASTGKISSWISGIHLSSRRQGVGSQLDCLLPGSSSALYISTSDDLRISTSHETNGQAYLRKEFRIGTENLFINTIVCPLSFKMEVVQDETQEDQDIGT